MEDLAVPIQWPASFRFFIEEEMSAAFVQSFGAGRVAVFSSRSPERETGNEDAAGTLALDAGHGVIAVADGVGGLPSGERAASLALHELGASCAEALQSGVPIRDAVIDGFDRANRAVIELGSGAATTLIVAEIDGTSVRTYHAGDSMILVVGQRGKIKLQTVMHSPVGYAVESGMLDQREAMHHEHRHLVSNMIGDPGMRIEVGSSLELAPRDTLLIASDGLFDNLHIDEIVGCIRKGELARASANLAAAAGARMSNPAPDHPSKPDDLTFILYRCR